PSAAARDADARSGGADSPAAAHVRAAGGVLLHDQPAERRPGLVSAGDAGGGRAVGGGRTVAQPPISAVPQPTPPGCDIRPPIVMALGPAPPGRRRRPQHPRPTAAYSVSRCSTE